MRAMTGGRTSLGSRPRVFFVTLSRRWWWGGVLAVVLLIGATFAWMDVGRPTTGTGGVLVQDEEAVPASSAPATMETVAPPWTAMDTEAIMTQALTPTVSTTAVRSHPFDELRLERERQRSRQAELLQATAQDASVSEARRRQAHDQLLTLWQLEGREAEIEQLLRAQGYTGVVVLSFNGAHVVVDGVLDAAAASLIGELVHRTAAVPREAITIVDGIPSGR